VSEVRQKSRGGQQGARDYPGLMMAEHVPAFKTGFPVPQERSATLRVAA